MTKPLPELLDAAGKGCSDAEMELALIEGMQKQLTTEATGLPEKLELYVSQLEALTLKTLRGTADVQLLKVRGALNKVAKPDSAFTQRSADIQEALSVVAAATAKLPDLATLVAKANTLLNGVKDLRTKADNWEKDKLRYAVRTELEGLRTLSDEAIKQAESGDIQAALATFKKAQDLALDGDVKKKMAGNVPPDPAEIKAIIGRKDGDAQLDEMIKNLDEGTQRKVVRIAFEARFGCKLEMLHDASYDKTDAKWDGATMARNNSGDGRWTTSAEDKKSPDLRRFYKVMSKLPEKHTRDNDELKKFRYRDSDKSGSSWAWGKHKEIVMNEGRADKSGIYGCGRPDEMPEDLKPECQPANDEPIPYFDWNTAHEVGHTLDGKLKFMATRANQSKFGGWREYHGSSDEVADALVGHYGFDDAYVRDLLKAGTPAEPPVPAGVDPVEWSLKRKLVDAHYARMKAGQNPWASNATAQSLAINGRVYQQSYDSPTWSSYELSARQEAISGYQFRSPLEWFSELYAAFKSNKLKPAHPAMEWLQRLDSQ